MKTLHTAKEQNQKSQQLSFREIDRFVSQQETSAAVAIQPGGEVDWHGQSVTNSMSKEDNLRDPLSFKEHIDNTRRREAPAEMNSYIVTYYHRLKGQREKHYKERLPSIKNTIL